MCIVIPIRLPEPAAMARRQPLFGGFIPIGTFLRWRKGPFPPGGGEEKDLAGAVDTHSLYYKPLCTCGIMSAEPWGNGRQFPQYALACGGARRAVTVVCGWRTTLALSTWVFPKIISAGNMQWFLLLGLPLSPGNRTRGLSRGCPHVALSVCSQRAEPGGLGNGRNSHCE